MNPLLLAGHIRYDVKVKLTHNRRCIQMSELTIDVEKACEMAVSFINQFVMAYHHGGKPVSKSNRGRELPEIPPELVSIPPFCSFVREMEEDIEIGSFPYDISPIPLRLLRKIAQKNITEYAEGLLPEGAFHSYTQIIPGQSESLSVERNVKPLNNNEQIVQALTA